MEFKIPFYHVVNMLLTGLVLLGGGLLLFPNIALSVLDNSIFDRANAIPEIIEAICFIAIAYEAGLIVNRIGSLLIEALLIKMKLIPFNNDYIRYNERQKKYPIMPILSREYALSRTGIALFVLLGVMALFSKCKIYSIPLFLIAVVYCASCRKNAKKIVALMGDLESKNDTSNNDIQGNCV